MGDWSEYFDDYPGGYFGEAPYTIPLSAEQRAERHRREVAAQSRATHTAEIEALISAHNPPTTDAIRRALEGESDARPATVGAFGQWINEKFDKQLSAMTAARLVKQLAREGFISRDGDGIRYVARHVR